MGGSGEKEAAESKRLKMRGRNQNGKVFEKMRIPFQPQPGVLQFNSSNNHPKSGQTPRVKRQQPLPQMPATLQGSPDHPHFRLTGYQFRSSHDPLSFDNSRERFTELRKVLLYYNFILLYKLL